MLLLSDKLSGFTTGAEWVVDGGQTLRPLPFYTDEEVIQMNRPSMTNNPATVGGMERKQHDE
jgi:hypothetical protein